MVQRDGLVGAAEGADADFAAELAFESRVRQMAQPKLS
jgi:hypothetical protein